MIAKKNLAIAAVCLCVAHLCQAEAFLVRDFNGILDPQLLEQNMTSIPGSRYLDALEDSTERLRALNELKEAANLNASDALFDLAVIYYTGAGVKPSNQTAAALFSRSFEINPDFEPAYANADHIKYGDFHRKDQTDLHGGAIDFLKSLGLSASRPLNRIYSSYLSLPEYFISLIL